MGMNFGGMMMIKMPNLLQLDFYLLLDVFYI
nr:MAG TPA: hypothetical protein [Caudoviricetes sp.]